MEWNNNAIEEDTVSASNGIPSDHLMWMCVVLFWVGDIIIFFFMFQRKITI